MRSSERTIRLPTTVESAFQLLVTPSAIRNRWSATRAIAIPGRNGTWTAAWGEPEPPAVGGDA